MQDDPDFKEELIETVFRNGTITVVGVVVAFSLGFLTHWAANPVPWQPLDILAVVPILVGIGFQMRALFGLLDPECLKLAAHRRIARRFTFGLGLTALGVFIAILLDMLAMAPSRNLIS